MGTTLNTFVLYATATKYFCMGYNVSNLNVCTIINDTDKCLYQSDYEYYCHTVGAYNHARLS